jgi:hypothetical protein
VTYLRSDEDVLVSTLVLGILNLHAETGCHQTGTEDKQHLDIGLGLTSIAIESCRFVASMKTSNSSRHLIGEWTLSHSAINKQIVENEVSPPDKALGSL